MANKKGGLGRGLDSLLGDLKASSISVFENASDKNSKNAKIVKGAEKNVSDTKNRKKKPSASRAAAKTPAVEKGLKSAEKAVKNSGKKASEPENARSKEPVQKAVEKVENAGQSFAEGIIYISLDDIKPNSKQPRKIFNEEALAELAQSIKDNGVIQPVLVRRSGSGYELVAGERRWRAARKAGLKKLPAIVRELSDQQNALVALLENMQREDLNMIEEAQGILSLMQDYGLTQEEAARAVGKSRPYVSNALRLLRLPEEIQEMVERGILSAGHAKAIAGLSGAALQLAAAKKAAAEGWSVRKIESFAEMKKSRPSKRRLERAAAFREVEENLSRKIGTKVMINGSESRGKVEIEYYSRAELERLIELLGDEYNR